MERSNVKCPLVCLGPGRTLIGIAFIVTSSCLTAQYYKPFHAGSKKLFARSTVPTPGHSLAFDSAVAVGGDSVFYHFGALNDTSTHLHPECSGWGSPYCYRAELPLWSGSLFRTDNTGRYWFRTLAGDSLHFDLNAAVGFPHVFYEDSVQRFSCVKSGPDTMTVLGHTDSVFTYLIAHSDLDGVPIPSPLNGQPIIIGKALGLVRFFQIDLFPDVLSPVLLVGNKAPDLGLHRITSADVYDYQPGDIVQYKSYSGYVLPPGQPFSYSKSTILSRSETSDSVEYDIELEWFTVGSSDADQDTFVYRYSKHEVLSELPFDRFAGSLVSLTFSTAPSCDVPLWRSFQEDLTALGPCEYGGCWVAYDTQGPPPSSTSGLTLGLGKTHSFHDPPVYSWEDDYFSLQSIPYFRKNGVDCGVEVHVGIQERHGATVLSVAPNPSDGMVTIKSTQGIRSVQVMDGYGRTVLRAHPTSDPVHLDLSFLPAATYIARIVDRDGSPSHQRIQIVR